MIDQPLALIAALRAVLSGWGFATARSRSVEIQNNIISERNLGLPDELTLTWPPAGVAGTSPAVRARRMEADDDGE